MTKEEIEWNGLPPGDFYATFWAYDKWWWVDLRIENGYQIPRTNRPGYATEAEARAACRVFAALPREEQEKQVVWAFNNLLKAEEELDEWKKKTKLVLKGMLIPESYVSPLGGDPVQQLRIIHSSNSAVYSAAKQLGITLHD